MGKGMQVTFSLQARDLISLDSGFIGNVVLNDAVGNAGNIDITTGSLSVTNGGQIDSFTHGRGNAGNITIQARDAVSFDGVQSNRFVSGSFSNVQPGAIGNGGNVNITAGSLFLTNGGVLGVFVHGASDILPGGQGIGGNVNVNVRDAFTISGANSGIVGSLGAGAIGRSGDVNIQAGNIFVKDGGIIISSTFGNGDSGNISITARDGISLDAASYIANNVQSRQAVGNAGNIDITTGSLSVTNGAQINSFTRGRGNAGNITIQARDTVTFDGRDSNGNESGLFSFVGGDAIGNGGTVSITSGSLSLNNGGGLGIYVSNASDGLQGKKGVGGTANINVRNVFTISGKGSGIFASIGNGVVGRGGDVNIKAGNLLIQDAGEISSFLAFGAEGRSGDVNIQAGNLFIKNGGEINSSTYGRGNSGNISITARDAISLDQTSYILNNVQSRQAVGNAGNIDITTGSLSVTNGAQINSFTRGRGNAGNITIQARDAVTFDGKNSNGLPSASFSDVQPGAVGNGGSINITASNLSLTNGGQLGVGVFGTSNTLPAGQGNGGIININLRDTLNVSGTDSSIRSGLGIETLGRSGNIKIESGKVQVIDGGIITSRSRGRGTAGEIDIKANSVHLNKGQITAETTSSNGGNINLNLSDYLLLRNNSLISTTAGTAEAGGNGGNITINAPFIIAVPKENSDISANAYSGKGGNVNIRTRSILGIEARPKATPETNDITASSELGVQGQINIIQPEVQPTEGLIELPNQVLDASNQIAQDCGRGPNAKPLGEFIVTGRGIPPNSVQPLSGRTSIAPLATLEGDRQVTPKKYHLTNISQAPIKAPTPPTAIIEAQGWVKTADGKIVLVALAPQATPSAPPTTSACPNPSQK
jgi:large exoprotein involved in heme utilization and adhesion